MHTLSRSFNTDINYDALKHKPIHRPVTIGCKPSINWVKVSSVATSLALTVGFLFIYGVAGKMDYNDELLLAQSVELRRHEVVCEASRDEAMRMRYNVTLSQIAAENC